MDDAIDDVLRLSKGMTYKAAVSGLNFGGAKAVIIGDPHRDSSELLFRTFGRYVQTLNGRYITCEDVGTNPKMMEFVRIETRHVVGLPNCIGGLGDPSPVTAYGTKLGMQASLKKLTGKDDLTNVKVAIQGVGSVGYYLCKELHQVGAKLYITDIDQDAINRVVRDFRVTVVKPDEIYQQPVDIFAPCALGGVLHDQTIAQLKCSIVAGAANNPLEDENAHSHALYERSILYAPDYVINAGGLIDAATEFFHVRQKNYAYRKAEEIYTRLLEVYNFAAQKNIPTAIAAQQIAEQRIHFASHCKDIYARRDK
jgi:leucine dehydrogenase